MLVAILAVTGDMQICSSLTGLPQKTYFLSCGKDVSFGNGPSVADWDRDYAFLGGSKGDVWSTRVLFLRELN